MQDKNRVPAKRLKRRRRFQRAQPVAINLTDDDMSVLRYVATHRFRRSSDIYRYLSHRSEKKLRDRLRKLYDQGYLDRPLAQRDDHTILGNAHTIYALGNQGSKILSELDGVEPPKSDWTQKNRLVKRPHIHHSLRIADIADAVRRLHQDASPVTAINADDILKTAPESSQRISRPWLWHSRVRNADGGYTIKKVEPDYVFGLDFFEERRRYYYFCEADRGTMPVRRCDHSQTSIERKYLAYLAGHKAQQHRALYNIGNLRFLFVTSGQQRIATMLAALAHIARVDDPDIFFFIDADSLVAAPHILAAPWRNASGATASLTPSCTSHSKES
ncbi:MAG: replication-relaxation family protein [Alphaproteobacteria bacterium]|nr:replication-relaxation family protein [Alphaproteobacteria bacterium]